MWLSKYLVPIVADFVDVIDYLISLLISITKDIITSAGVFMAYYRLNIVERCGLKIKLLAKKQLEKRQFL